MQPPGLEDPDYLKPYREAGQPVTVVEGGRVSKDIRLIVLEER